MSNLLLTGVSNDSACQAPRITRASTRKFRPLAKGPGGRSYLARRIISMAPNNTSTYVEPFVRGGSVFLNIAPPSYARAVLNDADPATSCLWSCLRDEFNSFYKAILSIPYTEEAFVQQRDRKPEGLVDIAVRQYCIRRMSRGGMGKAFAWSDRWRGGRPGDVNAWITGLDELVRIHDLLVAGDVEIHNSQALDLIKQYGADSQAWLFAAPPYLPSTRTAKKVYGDFEMTYTDHEQMLLAVKAFKGKVMISAYANSLYSQELYGWRQVEIDMPNHAGQGGEKQRRVEVLWMNY